MMGQLEDLIEERRIINKKQKELYERLEKIDSKIGELKIEKALAEGWLIEGRWEVSSRIQSPFRYG